MDFSHFSKTENYFRLVKIFYPLRDILVLKLQTMMSKGFRADQIFFYGFSFGGRISLEAGKACGNQIFEAMDSEF